MLGRALNSNGGTGDNGRHWEILGSIAEHIHCIPSLGYHREDRDRKPLPASSTGSRSSDRELRPDRTERAAHGGSDRVHERSHERDRESIPVVLAEVDSAAAEGDSGDALASAREVPCEKAAPVKQPKAATAVEPCASHHRHTPANPAMPTFPPPPPPPVHPKRDASVEPPAASDKKITAMLPPAPPARKSDAGTLHPNFVEVSTNASPTCSKMAAPAGPRVCGAASTGISNRGPVPPTPRCPPHPKKGVAQPRTPPMSPPRKRPVIADSSEGQEEAPPLQQPDARKRVRVVREPDNKAKGHEPRGSGFFALNAQVDRSHQLRDAAKAAAASSSTDPVINASDADDAAPSIPSCIS